VSSHFKRSIHTADTVDTVDTDDTVDTVDTDDTEFALEKTGKNNF
jgi:hypothetical protein